jgi:hypothetical protein
MSTLNEYSTYLETDHDVRIEPIHAGGFLITQGYYLAGRTDSEGKEQYVQFKKAFSTAGDLLDFLAEAFNYPPRRSGHLSGLASATVDPLGRGTIGGGGGGGGGSL